MSSILLGGWHFPLFKKLNFVLFNVLSGFFISEALDDN